MKLFLKCLVFIFFFCFIGCRQPFSATSHSELETFDDDVCNYPEERNLSGIMASYSDIVKTIDVIIYTSTADGAGSDSDQITFDMNYKDTSDINEGSILGGAQRMNSAIDDFEKGEANRFLFTPVVQIPIQQLTYFTISNTDSDSWCYTCLIVIINNKRVVYSENGTKKWLSKSGSSSRNIDVNLSLYNPIYDHDGYRDIRNSLTSPRNISVITTTSTHGAADTDDDIYIKFIPDQIYQYPDYKCLPTANEYRLNSTNNDFKDGRTDFFSLGVNLTPSEFKKVQLTYRTDTTDGPNDWIFTSIIVLAGEDVVYYRDLISEPLYRGGIAYNYRYLGNSGGKIWIDKFVEPINESETNLVILPDTQGYALSKSGFNLFEPQWPLYWSNNADLAFYRQIEWIIDNMYLKNIKYVFHMGDLVEYYQRNEHEWKCARGGMRILAEADIPYGVVVGNHDIQYTLGETKSTITFDSMFPLTEHAGMNGFICGDGDSIRNSAWNIEINGNNYLILNLTYDPNPSVNSSYISWAKNVIAAHPGEKVIISTHSYLKPSGELSTIGKNIKTNIVDEYASSVAYIFSGHYNGTRYQKTDEMSPVAILSDFQGENPKFNADEKNHGNGWMRILTIKNSNVYVSTFSVLKYSSFLQDCYYPSIGFPNITDAGTNKSSTNYFFTYVY